MAAAAMLEIQVPTQQPAPAKRSNTDGKIDGTAPAERAGAALFDHRPTALPSGVAQETASQQFPSKAIRHPKYIGIVLFHKFLALPLLCGVYLYTR
jgi:hypothetical protein